jgi:hypothetical protein
MAVFVAPIDEGSEITPPSKTTMDATYVLLLLLVTYDLWSTHKIHRATIWGSTFLILMGQMTRFIGPSAPWHAFAHWVQSWGI